MSPKVPSLRVEEIGIVLAGAAERPVEVGDGSGRVLDYSHLDHALQVAAVLRSEGADEGLQVAGLVHDIGHLLGASDEAHAVAGAAAVQAALGDRVAVVVGLHVEAKRYLVASEVAYSGELSADSTASLLRQGGAMTSEERAVFEALPLAEEAVWLRRADERGKVAGLVVGDLGEWMELVAAVATGAGIDR